MQERGYQNAAGQASDSAAQRAAELEAGSRAGQYGQERMLQTNAASQLSSAYSNPLNYLAQSGAPELGTMQQIAQIVQGLAGNGQIATPNSTIVKQPGVLTTTHSAQLAHSAACNRLCAFKIQPVGMSTSNGVGVKFPNYLQNPTAGQSITSQAEATRSRGPTATGQRFARFPWSRWDYWRRRSSRLQQSNGQP
jgi:hypothetical protein